jgi:hypothetical protein
MIQQLVRVWSVLGTSQAEHGLTDFGDSLQVYGKNVRPEWIRTIDFFRVSCGIATTFVPLIEDAITNGTRGKKGVDGQRFG